MIRQFVIVNEQGEEIEWVDPVESYEESDDAWIVYNGHHEYLFEKDEYQNCTTKFKVLREYWEDEDV